jgi:hypothetical protein
MPSSWRAKGSRSTSSNASSGTPTSGPPAPICGGSIPARSSTLSAHAANRPSPLRRPDPLTQRPQPFAACPGGRRRRESLSSTAAATAAGQAPACGPRPVEAAATVSSSVRRRTRSRASPPRAAASTGLLAANLLVVERVRAWFPRARQKRERLGLMLAARRDQVCRCGVHRRDWRRVAPWL